MGGVRRGLAAPLGTPWLKVATGARAVATTVGGGALEITQEALRMHIPLTSRGGPKATDPVCHMEVDTGKPPGGKWDYKGQTYYFCNESCRS